MARHGGQAPASECRANRRAKGRALGGTGRQSTAASMPSTWPPARPPPSTIRPPSTGECSNIRPPQRKRPPGREPPTVRPIKRGSKFDELLDRAQRHGSPAGGLSTFCAQVGGLGHHRVSDALRPAHLQTADTGAIIKSASAARPLMKRQQPLCRCDTSSEAPTRAIVGEATPHWLVLGVDSSLITRR